MIAALFHAQPLALMAIAALMIVIPLMVRGLIEGAFAIAPFVADVIDDLGGIIFTVAFVIVLMWLSA